MIGTAARLEDPDQRAVVEGGHLHGSIISVRRVAPNRRVARASSGPMRRTGRK
jgi:hypothetical protein